VFYVLGAGLPKVLGVVCLVLAIAGLTQLPVNVAGVILIVVAALLFVIGLKARSVGLTLGAAVALVLGKE